VNADPRGNGTSIFTENGAAVREYSRRIEVAWWSKYRRGRVAAYFRFPAGRIRSLADLHVHGWGRCRILYSKEDCDLALFFSGRNRTILLLSKGTKR